MATTVAHLCVFFCQEVLTWRLHLALRSKPPYNWGPPTSWYQSLSNRYLLFDSLTGWWSASHSLVPLVLWIESLFFFFFLQELLLLLHNLLILQCELWIGTFMVLQQGQQELLHACLEDFGVKLWWPTVDMSHPEISKGLKIAMFWWKPWYVRSFQPRAC